MKHRTALHFALLFWLLGSPTLGSDPIAESVGPEDRSQIPKLIKQLSNDNIPKNDFLSNETYGGIAMRKLVGIGIEAVPALTRAAETIDKTSRWRAVQGLKRIGPPARTALPVLIRNLKTDLWSLRSEITDSLAKIDQEGTTAIPALKMMLLDENAYVRKSAAAGLRSYPTHAKTVVPALIAALKDKSPGVRAAAILSLGRIGTPATRIVPALLPLLKDRSSYTEVGHDVVWSGAVVDLVATVLSQFKDQSQIIVPAQFEALINQPE